MREEVRKTIEDLGDVILIQERRGVVVLVSYRNPRTVTTKVTS